MILSISPQAAEDLLVRGAIELIDVREAREWASGYIPGARHVPLSDFRANPTAVLSPTGLVFVCAAGVRSETAARVAVATRVYNLTVGMQGWTKAGLPLAYPQLAAAV